MRNKKNKTVLFYLGHPAHFHNIINSANILYKKGYKIIIVARIKDVLYDLIKNVPFAKILIKENRKNYKIKNLIFNVFKREVIMFVIAIKYMPGLLIGTDIVITHIGKILGIPSIILNEDDASQVPLLSKYGFKFSTYTLSPICVDIAPFNKIKIEYNGYHELAYLNKKYFKPDINRVKNLFCQVKRKYFILRFAMLNAHHDVGITGISTNIADRIISILEPYGNIYITSERPLEPQFEKYRILIEPKDIHHAIYFADMYIGDSQTMAAEAAVLGTPSLRYNDFVGKLGILEELEHKYKLTHGIKTSEPEKLYRKIEELLNTPDLKQEWQKRRDKMLSEKIDVTAFMVWFIENYPESAQIMKKNPDYQWKFK